MRGKRLFVAIDIPEAVTNALLALDPHVPGVRWLRREQIHLTVSFLGNVSSDTEETLREKLSAIHFRAFFMPVAGVGRFPAKGKPNVLWAGVGAGHPQLFHVYKRVQEAALSAGLEPDLRAWHPHITFARCRDVSAESVRPFLKKNADFDAGLVRVECFSLYSSSLGPNGSAYTRELEVKAVA
ncbi:MAG: RNA 2',3'-cyclic phosphodiesterase [Chthoniobacterales bacterium]